MTEKELRELQDIKNLLVLQLLASDVRAGDIVRVHDMDKGNFSHMFPVRKLSKNTK
jgi:hypothetical protein